MEDMNKRFFGYIKSERSTNSAKKVCRNGKVRVNRWPCRCFYLVKELGLRKYLTIIHRACLPKFKNQIRRKSSQNTFMRTLGEVSFLDLHWPCKTPGHMSRNQDAQSIAPPHPGKPSRASSFKIVGISSLCGRRNPFTSNAARDSLTKDFRLARLVLLPSFMYSTNLSAEIPYSTIRKATDSLWSVEYDAFPAASVLSRKKDCGLSKIFDRRVSYVLRNTP